MITFDNFDFNSAKQELLASHASFIARPNLQDPNWYNGIYMKYQQPVLTRAHIPPSWRYDLNEAKNPFLQERLGVNGAFNAGAIYHEGKHYLMARVEGYDRKSFFALAVSDNGIDGFEFIDEPIFIPDDRQPCTNMYDMRLIRHEDGWIYGLFCVERKKESAEDADEYSGAVAQAGIARTKDLIHWERLPDLVTQSPQQRNVVLHPEFVAGKYLLYTRPQDGFMNAGSQGGIGYAFVDTMDGAVVDKEETLDTRAYHTIKEGKIGAGIPPLETSEGWIHIAHAVRPCAAGLRYVLYAFMTDRQDPTKIIASPGGYFMAPLGAERVGDVSNVLFINGATRDAQDNVFLYYASSDTRTHVAQTTIERLLDYVKNTPPDRLSSAACTQQRRELVQGNMGQL